MHSKDKFFKIMEYFKDSEDEYILVFRFENLWDDISSSIQNIN